MLTRFWGGDSCLSAGPVAVIRILNCPTPTPVILKPRTSTAWSIAIPSGAGLKNLRISALCAAAICGQPRAHRCPRCPTKKYLSKVSTGRRASCYSAAYETRDSARHGNEGEWKSAGRSVPIAGPFLAAMGTKPIRIPLYPALSRVIPPTSALFLFFALQSRRS